MISENPQIGPLIDSILREEESKGEEGEGENGAPMVPQAGPQGLGMV